MQEITPLTRWIARIQILQYKVELQYKVMFVIIFKNLLKSIEYLIRLHLARDIKWEKT